MLIALVLAAAVIAPSEIDDPDGIVTTAPRGSGAVIVGAETPTTEARPEAAQVVAVTPHNLTTQEQIDRWVSARATESTPFAQDRGALNMGLRDDRQMHGFVDAAIGTGDYSSVGVGVSLPVGETGRLDLAYRETKNGFGYPGYGYGYARPGEFGYGGLGYGSRVRPYDSFYGEPGRSRSMSMKFSWDRNDSRDEREDRSRILGFYAED
jgi:hypothetical protein